MKEIERPRIYCPCGCEVRGETLYTCPLHGVRFFEPAYRWGNLSALDDIALPDGTRFARVVYERMKLEEI